MLNRSKSQLYSQPPKSTLAEVAVESVPRHRMGPVSGVSKSLAAAVGILNVRIVII